MTRFIQVQTSSSSPYSKRLVDGSEGNNIVVAKLLAAQACYKGFMERELSCEREKECVCKCMHLVSVCACGIGRVRGEKRGLFAGIEP